MFFTYLVTLFCYAAEENGNNNSDLVTITGIVQHLTFGGGFYGIEGDDGKEYEPLELDEGFQVENLRVKVYGRLIEKKLLFKSPYIPLEIIKIERELDTGSGSSETEQ